MQTLLEATLASISTLLIGVLKRPIQTLWQVHQCGES